jgi:hypothetical protein
MKSRIIFKFLYNFPMIVPILLQVLRQDSSELTMLFLPCFRQNSFESRAELELLLNLNVWDYVKPEFEKITEK